MLFNSYIFLFLFLPLALAGYFFLNRLGRYELSKYFLTGMSLWFYAYFNVSYLWIILISILVNYICHLGMVSASSHKKARKTAWFLTGLIFNLGLLFYFKYFNFFVDNLNSLFHTSYTLKQILLPLGISFFTFQQIAFLADTKKGEVSRQPLADYMLFVTFFPQLIAGPIVSHREMLPQFQDKALKHLHAQNLYTGFRIFVLGLAKKVLLADIFGQAVQWGYDNYQVVFGFGTALMMLFYTLQIYFDFSGYCDMARGIGYLFNIRIPVNFSSPYKAENIQDFWGRWHMTLTRFFTGYLYIPLGGNRKGTLRTYLNILIIFFVSGIWHGAGYTFILWGFLHGLLNVFTRMFHKFKGHISFLAKDTGVLHQLRRILAITATFLLLNITWVFFRADSVTQALTVLGNLFDFGRTSAITELASFFNQTEVWYLLKVFHIDQFSFSPYLGMAAYCLLSAFILWGCKNIAETENHFRPRAVSCILLSALFLWCLTSLSGVSSFLYFNF